MRVYIAGPMRGHYLYNFPAFDRVESQLICDGHDPVNPANLDREDGFDPMDLALDHPDWDWSELPPGTESADFATRDLELLATCDAIYMLKGWGASTGARAEYAVAKWRGLEVMCDEGGKEDRKPDKAAERKATPLYRGLLMYFPDACQAVARLFYVANEQHNPGEPMHWSREKSADHPDCLMRHLVDAGTLDDDGQRHSAKVAWRALALLQTEIERERQ